MDNAQAVPAQGSQVMPNGHPSELAILRAEDHAREVAALRAEIERRDEEVKYWKAINNQHVAEIERLTAERDEGARWRRQGEAELYAEIERLKTTLTEIERICHVPTPQGTKAYTHFMRDFDQIRRLCKQ